MLEINLTIPDLWQQEAVRALKDGMDVVVDAPTGAGKTWVFELFFESAGFGKNGRGQAVFTVPTRALANDKYIEWQQKGWNVGIATGDLAENLDAPVIVATLETQRERFLDGRGPAMLVVDEYQMIADEQRGVNYELLMALAPPETQLLLLSGSVQNPQDIVTWFERLGRRAKLVRVHERPVPLDEEAHDSLPRRPNKVTGFWPSLASQAVIADLAPLLIFAPHRSSTEKIAKRIAAVFPEDDPIELSDEMKRLAGKDLTRMLRSRVAFHHSGLSYAVRSGIIEPLAKKGQLRVIVATMGLAAGINFSVRSVTVSDTTYNKGPFLEQLRPDELLQMFGRAGRRGLDDAGFVITTRSSPRLADASPRRLRRVNQIDWPTLIRVMDGADAPFETARSLCERLFSEQRILLGIERAARSAERPNTPINEHSPFKLGPHREEILALSGEWEATESAKTEVRPLSECHVMVNDQWRPALRSTAFVKTLGNGGICKIGKGAGFEYGLETKAARRQKDDQWEPLPWLRKLLDLPKSVHYSERDLDTAVLARIVPENATEARRFERDGMLVLHHSFATQSQGAFIDSAGKALIDPPTRNVALEVETSYANAEGESIDAPEGSAAHAWRKLGLVDPSGHPTLRGQVFSRFQKGEGLMVAAALEDETYPIDELAIHLANIRAGHRFDEADGGESERLAAASRHCFGMVDYPGYLELGLCPGFGGGAAELLQEQLEGKKRTQSIRPENLSDGDIERAFVEWLSLLRHVAFAAPIGWNRWLELQSEARRLLEKHAQKCVPDLPKLPLTTLNHKVRLRLVYAQF